MTVTTANDTRALASTLLNNNVLSGQAFVFYVAQNGSVESLTITPTSADSIVASPGPRLPSSLQGGHVLALAAGTSEADDKSTPQVGVLTSNGSVYYDLYFSFFNNSAWTAPQRTLPLPPPISTTQHANLPSSPNNPRPRPPPLLTNHLPHLPHPRKRLPPHRHLPPLPPHQRPLNSLLQRVPNRRRRHRPSLRQQPLLKLLHPLRLLGQRHRPRRLHDQKHRSEHAPPERVPLQQARGHGERERERCFAVPSGQFYKLGRGRV